MLNHHQRTLLIIGFFAIALASCDKTDERFEISGQVKYQSELVPEGKILFLPTDESRPQAIAQIQDGAYATPSAGGVFVGNYKVQVFGYRGTGKTEDLGPLYGTQEQQVQFIPAKFNHETELTVDFSRDERTYDFDL